MTGGSLRVTFYGVRGSFPVAHPKVAKVGGNTSCVAIRAPNAPTLVIDAGTGLRRLSQELLDEGFGDGAGQGAFLFSHTHWDHIQGFMYFAPFYREGNDFQVVARAEHDTRLKDVFAGQADSRYFGYGLDAFNAKLGWKGINEGDTFTIGPYTIKTVRLNHPGIAVAYRVEIGDKSFIYMSDTAPYDDQLLCEGFHERKPDTDPEVVAKLERYKADMDAFVKGADVLTYDTFFTAEQYAANPHWGHSTAEEGIRLARQGEVERFYNFHHHPEAWDDELEERVRDYQNRLGGSDLQVLLAREGESIEL